MTFKKSSQKFQVGDLKNKWKTGEVETAGQKEAGERKELEVLKVSQRPPKRILEAYRRPSRPVHR